MNLETFAGTTKQVAETELPTRWGRFRALGFERPTDEKVESAMVLILGDVAQGTPLVRIHSECLTGDVLGSMRCDCGEQLKMSMEAIAEEGAGILIYEKQEGRGIGLMAKLRAYGLQDAGMDTVEANEHLGYAADCRDFVLPAEILQLLGINQVRLMTNNPEKIKALTQVGISVERVPCETLANSSAHGYLLTKKLKMGHDLSQV